MTTSDAYDANADTLELMTLTPDLDRAERVRAKCRAQLGRYTRRLARRAEMTKSAWHVLAPALVGAFCVFYITALVATTIRLEDIFH